LKITLVDVRTRKTAINKDLAGGFGTASNYGKSLPSRALAWIKRSSVRLPVLSLGYIAAILKEKGHEVDYSAGQFSKNTDLFLIYGSLVEHQAELAYAKEIKNRQLGKVGFVGSLASAKPDLFTSVSDFVIHGEAENILGKMDLRKASGIIQAEPVKNLEEFPFPDWSVFPYKKFAHKHYISGTPFFPILSSKGCPFSCAFYCPYPSQQGSTVRYRSAKHVVDEMEMLIQKYGAKGFLFRDPIFTLQRSHAAGIAEEILRRKINTTWACETHLIRLDPELIDLFHRAGLRGLNVGIESVDIKVLQNVKRKTDLPTHQKEIIEYCEKKGIKVCGFYLFGNATDTEATIRASIQYAIQLPHSYAQFNIVTPYPGTPFYDQIKDEIFEKDWNQFDVYTPTFNHPHLRPTQLISLKEEAYRAYYFRPKWLWRHFISNPT